MADNRGKKETDKLKQNLEEQLERLLQQLEDLKQEKDNMEESEYNEMLNDTMEQLKEFQKRLEKMISGNMTLVDQVGSYQLVKLCLPENLNIKNTNFNTTKQCNPKN
jgi:TolA-binding protein